MIEVKLPDEVMEQVSSGSREEAIGHLSKFFDTVIKDYDSRFQKRVGGIFGQPLSRYEKSMLKDFLIDMTLGKLDEASSLAAEALTR